MFQTRLFEIAKQNRKKIVLPESSDERILKATASILEQDIADIILLGNITDIDFYAKKLNINISKATIIDPLKSIFFDKYAFALYEVRKNKNVTIEDAKKLLNDVNYFATMMVYCGDADGMVSGAIHPTSNTIRPALQIIKTKKNVSIISGAFIMCFKDTVLFYADCAINTNPTSEDLAQIAITTAKTAQAFGFEPKVAMLSYSTGDSGKGADVDKVKIATQIVHSKEPNLLIEGPIQYDAAVNIGVAQKKLPNSKVAGHANVFIFPDLNSGNITYKAVQRSANIIAIGPILQGLNKPINDLSRGCLVEDIINTIAITAIQASRN